MRVFICSFNNFSIAIPINYVSSITLIKENFNKPVEYKDNGNFYVSLPLFLKNPSEIIKHGIILKNIKDDNNETDSINEVDNSNEADKTPEEKIILLTTEIECETEIKNDKIFSIQKTFNCMQFSFIFSGIFFDSLYNRYGNTILLLNPDFFLKNMKRE
jgi:hypothetical protein